MSAGHTPGPWEKRKGFLPRTTEIFCRNLAVKKTNHANELAAVVTDSPEGRANALLIAAAPELLAALQHALAYIEGFPCAKEPFGAMKAAVKKATGAKP